MTETRKCLVCHFENPFHATKCERCNAPLRVGETMKLSDKQADETVQERIDTSGQRLPRGTLALYLIGRGQPLMVDANYDVSLGRFAPGQANPSVDLTKYHAGLLGVSRMHAVIHPSGNGYSIEDLNSTNGTWVNETKLTPGTPHPLKSGDQVRLGQLVMYISFTA